MFRDRALRVALVLVGLMFLAGVFSLMQWGNSAKAFEQMLASVYATLGVFLIIAAFNPPAHRSLIAFTAWSSIVHGAVMGVQAVKGVSSRIAIYWKPRRPCWRLGWSFSCCWRPLSRTRAGRDELLGSTAGCGQMAKISF